MRDRPAPDKSGSPNGPSGPGTEGSGAPAPGGRRRRRIDRNVKLLGINSLLTDISSESVNAALPLYLKNVLGFSALAFGIFDGIYQGMSAVLRIFGGLVADRRRRHKEVAGAGYALSAACKLGLLASTTAVPTAGVLFLDRMGKGIRTAPRDALISLSSEPENLGASFGVHRAYDTIGAVIGPILAYAILQSWAPDDYRAVFVVSLCVAVLGLGVLMFFVQNPSKERLDASKAKALTRHAGLRELMARPSFRRIAVAGALLSFMTVSDAFIYLVYQKRTDMIATSFPLLFVGTSLAYLLLAVPLGRLADRIGRGRVFIAGHLLLIGCYAVLRTSGPGFLTVATMLALLGAYYAATDGVLMAMASSTVPEELRTSGLAWLTTLTVAAKLGASIMFGLLWQLRGFNGAVSIFLAGMLVALPVAILILFRSPTRHEVPAP
ncbi:MAG: MFS transporter [Actinobacteria bacterium]|nr:MFS transporter [Actinomycetota bacterium]